MFGWVRKEKLELTEARVADLQNLLNRMEVELHYWRTRADEERERADRINDVVMSQNGLPDVTPTVRKEKSIHVEKAAEDFAAKQAELSEMFSDSFDAQDDLNWIDPDLQNVAQGWMDQAKVARESKAKTEPSS